MQTCLKTTTTTTTTTMMTTAATVAQVVSSKGDRNNCSNLDSKQKVSSISNNNS
jgi:hypothetical protein